MVTTDEFRKFIGRFRCDKGQACTHTSIDLPKARLHVPDDRMKEFYQMYQHAIVGNVPLHLTEKPAAISPMRVDLDFRFILNASATPVRVYTSNHVERILNAYNQVLSEYIDPTSSENLFDAYVMEKPEATEYRGKLKDGIHIIYPNLICGYAFQHLANTLRASKTNTTVEESFVCRLLRSPRV